MFFYLVTVLSCEWVKVPLKTRDPDFTSFGEERGSGIVSDKLDLSLEIPFRNSPTRNRTKQMDLELDTTSSSSTRRKFELEDRPVAPKPTKKIKQVAKRRKAEPFNLFTFIRSIRDSFFSKPKASVDDKVGFLQQIRDNILSEISRDFAILHLPRPAK